ncbi:hypothetical protein HJC23_011567 [Cyclotella cryptica]|uniref:C2H2-type domain-containing protein n=1 Tax=Cyclotella cryptica TaxID=29204 RepID=A0ABD3QR82_9STRA|eukprot:CCRYP_002672-RB/>CCRYP_002672-RB protein AED:0.01 eAED:0.01 QI:209/1/1/1/0.5/0.33/3/4463/1067
MPPRDSDSLGSPVSYQRIRQSQTSMEHPTDPGTKKKKSSSKSKQRDKDKSRSERDKSKSKDGRKSKSDDKRHHRRDAEIPPDPNTRSQQGVTVSSFLSRQKSMQRETESYRSNANGYNDSGSSGKPSLLTIGDAEYFNRSPVSSHGNTVDTVPSDHPSSSIIQTHRTCTLCHRTLSRKQFSERDRFLVHLSLGPGAVCRTCTMTVCATKLKMMPSHEQLLMDYANRGEYLVNSGLLPALKFPPGAAVTEGALVLHSGGGSGSNTNSNNDIGGSQALVPFDPSMNNANSQPNPFPTNNTAVPLTMGVDVNANFSGILPEEERPTHIADCKYIDCVLSMPCYAKLNSMELFYSSKDVSVSMAALDAVKLYGTVDSEYFIAHDGDGNKVVPRSVRKGRNAENGGSSPKNDKNVNPKSIVCLVIGEGNLPRTAVLASLHYGWTTLSIDPTLSEDWDGFQDDVPNYTGYSGTISEFMTDDYTDSFLELSSSQSNVQHLVIVAIQTTKDQMRLKGRSNINEIRARYEDVPTTLVSMSPLRKATLAPKRRDGQCGSKLEKDVGYEPNCSYIDEGVFSACRLVEVWNFHNEDNGSGDEEGSNPDEFENYDEESIEGDRQDSYRDPVEEPMMFSMEQLSAENMSKSSDSVYRRFQQHIKEYEADHEKQEGQRKNRLSRKTTIDSMSTLSTKGAMPLGDPSKKRSSIRQLANNTTANKNDGAMVLAISSRLEEENSRRKSKGEKKGRKQKKSSFQPRPIPDDIPEGVEIGPGNFVGEGPTQVAHQLVEWNQNYDDVPHDRKMTRVSSDNIDAYADKGSHKAVDYADDNYYPTADTWDETSEKHDDDESYSHRSGECYEGDEKSYDDLDNKSDRDNYNSGHDERGSYQSGCSEEWDAYRDTENGNSESYDAPRTAAQNHDRGYYRSQSDEYYEEERVEGRDANDSNSEHNEQVSYHSHSSEEFDTFDDLPSRSKKQGKYYSAFDRDDDNSGHSSNYVFDDQDQTSTNSGIAALNDFNASRNKIDESSYGEEDDVFPDCWSDDEDLVRTPGSSSVPQKLKPWHTKETHGNSFMSYESFN